MKTHKIALKIFSVTASNVIVAWSCTCGLPGTRMIRVQVRRRDAGKAIRKAKRIAMREHRSHAKQAR